MKFKLSFLFLFLFVLTSCGSQKVILTEKHLTKSIDAVEPDMSTTNAFFLGGAFQTDVQNVSKLCKGKGKLAVIRHEIAFFDAFLTYLTNNIYSPRSTEFFCEATLS